CDLVVLARVAQIEAPPDPHAARAVDLVLERAQALPLELGEPFLDALGVPALQGRAMCLYGVIAQGRDEAPQRGERARVGWDEHAAHPRFTRQRSRVNGSGSAVCDECEPAEVVAALHRDQLQGA